MSTVLVNALPGTLPVGFCPTGATALQDLYNEFILRTQFSLSADKAFYNFGPTAPTPENRQFPWLQTSSGYPVRWWVFIGGSWVWPHAVPASSLEWRLWGGTTAALETYDGGESAAIAVSPTTGPMWEVNSDFDGRSPMGAGAIPTSNPAKTLALAENFGEGAHALVTDETPEHDHNMASVTNPNMQIFGSAERVVDAFKINASSAGPNYTTTKVGSPVGDADLPHNTVHPVRGCYIIKRTARIYYRQ